MVVVIAEAVAVVVVVVVVGSKLRVREVCLVVDRVSIGRKCANVVFKTILSVT